LGDVGALVLTLGERTTQRAVASVRSQSLPIEEVVVLKGVTPFHHALNVGAERIRSPFFLQVDSDFVLDRECAWALRNAMDPDVGIAVGALRDPLIGPIAGVKLFRSRCFASSRLGDTIAREVDFCATLEQQGWLTRYMIGHREHLGTLTLGEHRPRYTVDYVFGTYFLLGARYGSRGDVVGLLWRFSQLRRSSHAMASVARVAMAHGVFADEARDVSKPVPPATDSAFLRSLARLPKSAQRPAGSDGFNPVRQLRSLSPVALFDAFLEFGSHLRLTSYRAFRDCLAALGESGHPRSWLAEVALGHGALGKSCWPIPGPIMTTLERLADPAAAKLFARP
jgi:hypothetical protein